jgi:hypothetical protein
MSKIRSVRQRTDAPRQDEGPGTGAALPAAGGVYLGFAVADGRRSALLVQTGELLGFTALGAVLVPAALHRLRRGPRCAAAHWPALAGGQFGQRFAGWRPGVGLVGRARVSHPRMDLRTAHVSPERTVKSLPDGQLIRLLAGV